jgi:hypothetical protein
MTLGQSHTYTRIAKSEPRAKGLDLDQLGVLSRLVGVWLVVQRADVGWVSGLRDMAFPGDGTWGVLQFEGGRRRRLQGAKRSLFCRWAITTPPPRISFFFKRDIL